MKMLFLTYANPVAGELYKKLGYKDEIVGMNFANLVLNGIYFDKMIEGKESSKSEIEVGKFCLQVKYA